MQVHPKVVASAIGAVVGGGVGDEVGTSIATVITWTASLHGVTVPDAVNKAIGVLCTALIGGAFTFAAGWLKGSGDAVPTPQEPPAPGANGH